MSIDSTANLLFNIGANSDDAEENIQRFRALLGKDLDDLSGEFSDWAEEVLGDIATVQGAMIAGVSVIAAAGAAAIGVLIEAGHKYEEYVETIESGTKVTGIAAEDMSALHYAAEQTGTSFEAVTRGVTFFEAAVVRAREGQAQYAQAFARMGVSQKQLADGERDIMPLLEQVMDKFHGLASGTEKASIARDLFSRGGTEMIKMLSIGSEELRKFTVRAKEMGLVIGEGDIRAMEANKAATRAMKEELQGLAVTAGREVLPMFTKVSITVLAFAKAIVEAAQEAHYSFGMEMMKLPELVAKAFENVAKIRAEVTQTVDAMTKSDKASDILNDIGEGLGKVGKKAKEATQDFRGVSNMLDQVNQRMASGEGEYEKVASEITHLSVELAKARAEYSQLQSEGKLTGEAAAREAASLNALPAAILNLWDQLRAQIDAKRREAQAKAKDESEAATSDLVKHIQDQHSKTIEAQEVDWDDEIARLTASYQKKGQLTAENEKLIADLKEQGLFRIQREQADAYSHELLDLQSHLATILEANMDSDDRMELEHNLELAALKRDEAEKLKLTKEGSAERLILEQQFAINEKAINDKYAGDLQALENSQGWQGVFGSKFGEMIRGNEDLTRQWAQSQNQSLLTVKATMEGLKETGSKLFEEMAQGMGGAIASAMVYKKSIGEAMEAAMKSTLESLAGQACTYAIYATALGFLDLAEGDYEGAGAAFTSAAIWGTVGAAAGIAGRAIPGGGSSGGSSGGSTNSGSGSPSSAFDADHQNIAPTQNRGGVNIYVQGHIIGNSGINELTGMINDAVMNQDVTLTATNTRTGVQVTK